MNDILGIHTPTYYPRIAMATIDLVSDVLSKAPPGQCAVRRHWRDPSSPLSSLELKMRLRYLK